MYQLHAGTELALGKDIELSMSQLSMESLQLRMSLQTNSWYDLSLGLVLSTLGTGKLVNCQHTVVMF